MRRDGAIESLEHESLRRLESERLVLRIPQREDSQAVFDYASKHAVARFMGWNIHSEQNDTCSFLQDCIDAWSGEERLPWMITVDGVVVGMIEARLKGRYAGIGYVLAPDSWGKGYATEALCSVCEALLCYSPISALISLCVTENVASARVLEKCGFVRERLIPNYFLCPNLDGEKHDVWFYARHREQHGES